MSLRATFIRILRFDRPPGTAPVPMGVGSDAPAPSVQAPAGGEPPVSADALLDLALVMRDQFWPDAGFGSERDRSLACMALARCFPHYVTTVERCPCEPDPAGEACDPKCDICPTDAQMRTYDGWLTDHLRAIPRPAIVPPLTDALRAFLPGATSPEPHP